MLKLDMLILSKITESKLIIKYGIQYGFVDNSVYYEFHNYAGI